MQDGSCKEFLAAFSASFPSSAGMSADRLLGQGFGRPGSLQARRGSCVSSVQQLGDGALGDMRAGHLWLLVHSSLAWLQTEASLGA